MLGDVYRIRNWDDCRPNLTMKFGLGRQKRTRVHLMVDLGETTLDTGGDTELIEKRLNELGWFFRGKGK